MRGTNSTENPSFSSYRRQLTSKIPTTVVIFKALVFTKIFLSYRTNAK